MPNDKPTTALKVIAGFIGFFTLLRLIALIMSPVKPGDNGLSGPIGTVANFAGIIAMLVFFIVDRKRLCAPCCGGAQCKAAGPYVGSLLVWIIVMIVGGFDGLHPAKFVMVLAGLAMTRLIWTYAGQEEDGDADEGSGL
jgi:hypothetical protein